MNAKVKREIASAPVTIDLNHVLADRGNQYGLFIDHARVTQQLKQIVAQRLDERNMQLVPDQQEALDMILHKIGRIVNGNPDNVDSWVDIGGYSKLVADRLQGSVK